MARINAEVIQSGYELLDEDIHALIRGRCDSFVLKTDVHFPTDTSLLYDAIRTLIRVSGSYDILRKTHKVPETLLLELKTFSQHAERQIDQIERRVIKDEVIPHDEKVFSLFQGHTEWVSKGYPLKVGSCQVKSRTSESKRRT